jgi:hypothetical protein
LFAIDQREIEAKVAAFDVSGQRKLFAPRVAKSKDPHLYAVIVDWEINGPKKSMNVWSPVPRPIDEAIPRRTHQAYQIIWRWSVWSQA